MGAGTGVFTNPGQQATSSSNPYANTSSPYIQAAQQTALGNLAGAQAATAANRVNQSTPYGNLNYVQTGTDANGNPIWSANQTLNPMFQGTLANLAQNAQQSTQQPLIVQATTEELDQKIKNIPAKLQKVYIFMKYHYIFQCKKMFGDKLQVVKNTKYQFQ